MHSLVVFCIVCLHQKKLQLNTSLALGGAALTLLLHHRLCIRYTGLFKSSDHQGHMEVAQSDQQRIL